MAKDEDANGGMRITSPDDGGSGCFARFVIVVLVLIVILLVTICVLVRLDGPQSIIESWLTDNVGMEMSISGARIGLPFVLVLENPVSADFDLRTKGGFKAREIRIGQGWGFYRTVSVEKGVLVLARKGEDSWLPDEFARYGRLFETDLGELSRATSILRTRVKLHVEDGSIAWVDGTDGKEIASVDILSFDMQKAGVPKRKMYHYSLSVDRCVHPNGVKVESVERDWLASDAVDYIELHRSSKETPLDVRGFWAPCSVGCVE